MSKNVAIWETQHSKTSHKALDQVGKSTARREIRKLSEQGIAVFYRKGNKIVKIQNGRETILKRDMEPLQKVETDKNGVVGCVRRG